MTKLLNEGNTSRYAGIQGTIMPNKIRNNHCHNYNFVNKTGIRRNSLISYQLSKTYIFQYKGIIGTFLLYTLYSGNQIAIQ